jgi:CHAT domain-containing protein/tetratricopeptide (TPR) repeat protein
MPLLSTQAFREQVFALLQAVAESDGPDEARSVIRDRIKLACDYRLLPVLSELNERIVRTVGSNVDVGFYTQFILDEVHTALLGMSAGDLQPGGLCTLLMLADSFEDLMDQIKRYHSLLDNRFIDEFENLQADLEGSGQPEFAEAAEKRMEAAAGFKVIELLGQLQDKIHVSTSAEEATQQVVEMARPGGQLLDHGLNFVRRRLEEMDEDERAAKRILPMVLEEARTELVKGQAADAVKSILLANEEWRMFLFVVLGPSRMVSKAELIEMAEAEHPRQGSLMRLALAEDDAEAWQVVSHEPGLFSAEAERQALAFAEQASFFRDERMADRMRQAVHRLRRWRDELGDPQRNLIVELAHQVINGARTLDDAIVTLESDLIRTALDVPHLGVVDELVEEMVRNSDLWRAEVMAVLNQHAAGHFSPGRIHIYANISLAGIWLRRGKSVRAAPLLEEAVELSQSIHDVSLELMALGTLGLVFRELGQLARAITYQEHALERAQEFGDQEAVATVLGNLAMDYFVVGEMAKSREAHERLRRMAEEAGDNERLGKVLGNLGLVAGASGEFRQAIQYLEQAVAIAREQGSKENELNALSNLGQMYAEIGDLSRAEQTEAQVLELSRLSGNRPLEASAFLGLAGVAYRRGEIIGAIEHNEHALALIREMGIPDKEIVALTNLGICHWRLNQLERAMERYQQAREIVQRTGAVRQEASILLALGNVESQQQRWAEAEEHYREVIAKARELEDRDLEAIAMGDFARAQSEQGRFDEAEKMQRAVVAMARELGTPRHEMVALANLGIVLARQKRGIEAEQAFKEGARLADQIGDRWVAYDCYHSLGTLYDSILADQLRAAAAYHTAIEVLETQRTNLSNIEEYERRFFEDKSDVYRQAAECDLRLGRAESALDVLEKGRARLLASRLGRRNPMAINIPDELYTRYVRLFDQAQMLRARVHGEMSRQERRMQKLVDELAKLEGRPRDWAAEQEEARQALQSVEAELHSVIQEIRKVQPEFEPELRVDSSGRWKTEAIRDPACAVVVLFIGIAHGRAIVLHSSGIQTVNLPNLTQADVQKVLWGLPPPLDEWYAQWRSQLSAESSDEQLFALSMSVHFNLLRIMATETDTFEVGWGWAYNTLTKEKEDTDRRINLRRRMTPQERDAWDSVTLDRNPASKAEVDLLNISSEKPLAMWGRLLDYISQELGRRLWLPLLPVLQGLNVMRVVFVPDAQLQTAPLHLGQEIAREGTPQAVYDVLISPSLPIYADCARWSSERSALPPSLTLINPVEAPSRHGLPQDLAGPDLETQRLHFLFQARQFPTLILRGNQATVNNIVDTPRVASVWHFAGHARYLSWDPGQSALRCARNEDLTMRHIQMFMDFRDTRLVTLSACETGVTQLNDPNQNYVGLFSSFLVVGVPAMLVSLWPVEDISTALLMERFYQNYLESLPENLGTSHPAQALRKAQNWLRTVTCQELQTHPALQHQYVFRLILEERPSDECPFANPYYWAGFMVVGA